MRMIIPNDLRPSRPRLAMRDKKGGGVDLEVTKRIGRDIGRRSDLCDDPIRSQQQAAAFGGMRRLRLGQHHVQQTLRDPYRTP